MFSSSTVTARIGNQLVHRLRVRPTAAYSALLARSILPAHTSTLLSTTRAFSTVTMSSTSSTTTTAAATPESPSLSTSVAPSTTSSDNATTTASTTASTTTSTTTPSAASSTPQPPKPQPRIIHIDMTSDNICPWCYIGKRRLERAITQLDPTRVTPIIRIHPFFLDSTLPTESIDKLTRYQSKFGVERTTAMLARMKATGAEEGIAFSYGGKIGSTLLSHRLLRYVQVKGGTAGESEVEVWRRVGSMVDILFRAYFEQEQDIASIDTLARLAATLPELAGREKEIREWLEGKDEDANVQNEVINAYRKGIDGVPHFVFDGQYQVSGGEKAETFLQVFKRLGVYQ